MTTQDSSNRASSTTPARGGALKWLAAIAVVAALASFALAWLIVTIFNRKAEAQNPYVRLVEVTENTTDPIQWSRNWPRQYDAYRRTVDVTHTRYGGSEGPVPESRLETDPWLKRMFAGYAFAIDFRERRGHGYMLYDQEQSKRITERPQPGACLHCHASVVPTYRRLGLESLGKNPNESHGFDWPAVIKGFEKMSTIPYPEAHGELLETLRLTTHGPVDQAHPVSCVDCHDPDTMALRVTRPGFLQGIQKLAASDAPTPHLPSIDRWRNSDRSQPYDPNTDATRQEMRSFACAQCHVEYYCGPKTTMFFPWSKGLRAENIEQTYEETTFPDGSPFLDFVHAETGAPVFKSQHPEFETWSQGVHARSGVSCADCHMPYKREGATKVSDHWVRSPLLNISRSCQTCHPYPEAELLGRVNAIQDRTHALMARSGDAITQMLDAINTARKSGASDEAIRPVLTLQRKAQWRLDFVNSENSMGFHAPQETARLLGESIDYCRQAQVEAIKLTASPAPTPAKDTPPPSPPQ